MRANVVSSILVVGVLLTGYVLSCRYWDTDWGLAGLILYACFGGVLMSYVIIKWLWESK